MPYVRHLSHFGSVTGAHDPVEGAQDPRPLCSEKQSLEGHEFHATPARCRAFEFTRDGGGDESTGGFTRRRGCFRVVLVYCWILLGLSH